MKKSILSILILSGLLSANCTRNADETVSCSDTKLMWQDNAEVKSNSRTWDKAIGYCEDLVFAGYNDWRLPNINELRSLMDISLYNPVIKQGFININSIAYWSSTTYANDNSGAWNIVFYYGDLNWNYKTNNYYVRCVRDGQ